jgi:hypothetical protein
MLTTVARRAPVATAALGRRGYAEAADKIALSLTLPHQVLDTSVLFERTPCWPRVFAFVVLGGV